MAATKAPVGALSEVLAKGKKFKIGDRDILIHPMTLNDICDLEEKYGSLEELPKGMRGQRELLLFILDRCSDEPKMTLEQVGALFTLQMATGDVVARVFEMSGLISLAPDPEPSEGNAPAAPTEADAAAA